MGEEGDFPTPFFAPTAKNNQMIMTLAMLKDLAGADPVA